MVILIFCGYALWGLAAPLAWGHYGFHAGFHGAAARNLMRHGVFTPTPHVGRSAPPIEARYLHHPIVCPQYLVPFIALFGDHEWVLRLVPALFTLGILLLLIYVARSWWGGWAGVVAGAVFVLLPHNMVFCHLVDHETPGILYTLLGVTGFLSFLRAPGWRAAVLCLAGFGLAGLTDWPPYFIAFATAWAGVGYLLCSSFLPHRPERVAIWAAAAGLLLYLGHRLFTGGITDRLEWPAWQAAVGLFPLFLAMLVAGAAADVGRPGPDHRRKTLQRWVVLIGLCLVVVLTFWFHFKYTDWVGLGDDVRRAFEVRSGGDAWRHAGKYLKNVQHTFTTPVLGLAGLWLLSLPVRLALGRPLLRAVLPLVFLAGQLLHNLKFPNEVDIHNYRTYYYVIFASLAALDVLWELRAGLSWLVARLPPGSRPAWLGVVPPGATAVLLLGALAWQTRAALPVLREGRRRSGTLRFFRRYDPQLEKQRFFREVRRVTSARTVVLYTYEIHPRLEALWYLDRDFRRIYSLPRSRAQARRLARRTRRPWFRGGPRRRATPRPSKRPVVALLPAGSRRSRASLEQVLARHPVTRFGAYLLVDFTRDGARYRSYRLRRRPHGSLLARYLKGPYPALVVKRDLPEEWRTVTRFGLPTGGRPALVAPPPGRGHRHDWAAVLNARLAAGDRSGAARARKTLLTMIQRPDRERVSRDLRLLGVVKGRTMVELYLQAKRTHAPTCRLRIKARDAEGRIRQGNVQAVFPQAGSWRAGVLYIFRYQLRLPRGRYDLSLTPCDPPQKGDLRLGEAVIR